MRFLEGYANYLYLMLSMKFVMKDLKKPLEEVKAATVQFQAICGAFFKEKRALQCKTEEDVASFLQVPVQLVHDYESGKEGIPLYHVEALSRFLKTPPEEIMELHLDLEKKLMPKPLFDQDLIDGLSIGRVVKQARKTATLSKRTLAQLLSKAGYPISEQEIMKIELGQVPVSVGFWFNFCALTHLALDAVRGYSRWDHLAHINTVLRNKEIRIPVGTMLLNSLECYRYASKANDYRAAYLSEFSTALQRGWIGRD